MHGALPRTYAWSALKIMVPRWGTLNNRGLLRNIMYRNHYIYATAVNSER